MAAAVPILLAVGTAVSAVGAISAANAQKNAADFNKDVANRNAQISLAEGEDAARRQRSIAYQTTSAARANYGASGVDIEGSPEDILAQSAYQGELDTQNIRYNARLKAMGYGDTATLEGLNAKNSMTQGYYNAASNLLVGGAKTGYYYGDLKRK